MTPDFSTLRENKSYLLVSAIFLLITVSGALYTPLEWDEGSFLLNAEYFQGDESNFEESRPAAISFMIASIWEFTGENTLSARLLIIIFGLVTLFGFRRLAEEEFGDSLPVFAVFAFSPLMLHWSWHVYTDIPALLFVIGSMYFYRREMPLKAGITVAMAATFRYVFLVFGIGMAVAYLIENRSRLKEYMKGGFTGSIPLLLYSYLSFGNPLSKVYMYTGRVSRWSNSGILAESPGNISSMIQMFSALIPGIIFGWKESPILDKAMLVTYSVFMIVFSGNTFDRYWLAVLPVVILMAYRGFDKKIFYLASVFMIIISGSAVIEDIDRQMKCKPPLEDSIEYVESENLEGNLVFDQWAIAGYELDQTVYPPWQSLDQMRDKEGVNYAVMADERPYHKMESFSNSCITYNVYNLSSPS